MESAREEKDKGFYVVMYLHTTQDCKQTEMQRCLAKKWGFIFIMEKLLYEILDAGNKKPVLGG